MKNANTSTRQYQKYSFEDEEGVRTYNGKASADI